jgi:hypothetical protein
MPAKKILTGFVMMLKHFLSSATSPLMLAN